MKQHEAELTRWHFLWNYQTESKVSIAKSARLSLSGPSQDRRWSNDFTNALTLTPVWSALTCSFVSNITPIWKCQKCCTLSKGRSCMSEAYGLNSPWQNDRTAEAAATEISFQRKKWLEILTYNNCTTILTLYLIQCNHSMFINCLKSTETLPFRWRSDESSLQLNWNPRGSAGPLAL